MSRFINFRYGLPILATLIFLLAVTWERNHDPFNRIEFSLKIGSVEKVEGIVVLPKPAAKYPIVIYIHGHGGSLLADGATLRQIAELGLAAVDIEYNQTNQAAFNDQFLALQNYIGKQPWAQSNAMAWVGISLGAQCTLDFLLAHPNVQPQLLVRLSGGWMPELDAKLSSFSAQSPLFIRCPVLLVNGENDEVFPLADTKRLANLLKTNGTLVNLQIISGQTHAFGDDNAVLIRATAEYCRAHLPLADYTADLLGIQLDDSERARFNLAMQRAGLHRRELWKAVVTSSEPERHTILTVIGGLEDYDLAHITASHLKSAIHIAWQARRTYPWCRDTPLDIFEKVTANPRFFQEPIENWQSYFNNRMRREIKYCRTTQEASDRILSVMNKMVAFNLQESGGGIDPLKILDSGNADCIGLSILYASMCRSVGLAARVTRIVWQNSLGEHFCAEVWSTEDQRWHELDVSAGNRVYNTDWMLRVPKAAILTSAGERGVWNGLQVGRWDTFTNTIDLVYPSGTVSIKVMDHGIPAPNQTVGIQLPTVKGPVWMARARTDVNGEAELVLGKSAKYPYLFFVLSHDIAAKSVNYPYGFFNYPPGETAWQWLDVQSDQANKVILNLEDKRPFDPSMTPPILSTQ